MAIIPDDKIRRVLLNTNRRGFARAFSDGVAGQRAGEAVAQAVSTVAGWMHSTMLPYAETNLLPNGRFEQVTTNAALPTGFGMVTGTAGNDLSLDSTQSYAGKYSLKWAAGKNGVFTHNEFIPIEPGRAYKVEAMMRMDNVAADYLSVDVEYYDADGALLSTSAANPLTPNAINSWDTSFFTFEARNLSARYVKLKVQRTGTAQAFWLDTLGIYPIKFQYLGALSVDQVIPRITYTTVNLGGDSVGAWYDVGASTWRNLHYNNRFTSPIDAWYLIGGFFPLAGAGGIDIQLGYRTPAAAGTPTEFGFGTSVSVAPAATGQAFVRLAAGGTLDFQLWHNGAASRTLVAAAANFYVIQMF